MSLPQSPIIVLGAALTSLLFGCTSFVGADETSAGASEGITSSGDGPTAGDETPDPTAASASGSASSTSTTSGPSGVTTEDGTSAPTDPTDPTDPGETTSGVDTTTSAEATTADTESQTTDSTSDATSTGTSSSSSSSTGEDPEDLIGMPCKDDGDCSVKDGQECCTTNQCLDTCMTPCMNDLECPEDDMVCGHDYCLFPCDAEEDCDPWPGYTCQNHPGGTLCEI